MDRAVCAKPRMLLLRLPQVEQSEFATLSPWTGALLWSLGGRVIGCSSMLEFACRTLAAAAEAAGS